MGILHLITGDIIDNSKNMDAIVNAQNKYMQNGSGVCGAIYRAAGVDLLEYCQNNYKEYMNDGEVRITPGFKMNLDIIHVLAPKAYEQQEPLPALISCYENLLKSIIDNKYKKIILPSLGAGIHGYRHEQIAKPLIILLSNFCESNDVDLYFVNLNPTYTDFYLKEYLLYKGINLKDILLNLDVEEMLDFFDKNGLLNMNPKYLYKDFVKGKEIEELNLTEKIITLQYTIENFDITKEQLEPLISSF